MRKRLREEEGRRRRARDMRGLLQRWKGRLPGKLIKISILYHHVRSRVYRISTSNKIPYDLIAG